MTILRSLAILPSIHDSQLPAGPQLQLVGCVFMLDAHADTLVELCGAGLVGSVHTQPDAWDSPLLQLAECVQQQRLPEAAPAIGLAHAERENPAHPGVQIVTFL